MQDKNTLSKKLSEFFQEKNLLSIFYVFLLVLSMSFNLALASNSNRNSNNNQNSNSNANGNANVNSNANANTNTNNNSNANSNQNNNSQNSERYSNIDEVIQQKQKDLSNIQSKINTYNKMIDIKQAEQKTLGTQLDIIDNQIGQTQEEILQSQKDIEITDLEIQQLDLKISEQNELLKQKKAALQVLINDLYRKDEKDLIEVMLSYPGISSFIQEVAYNEQANERVFNKLDEINTLRKDLESKQSEQKNKHNEILTTIQKKNDKTDYLQGEQDSKQQLLTDTQGEEGRYQDLLKKVEEEKQTLLGDLDDLSTSKSSELGIVQSKQPKPTSGLAGTDWYFAQRDPRWGGMSIGNSNTLMSKYGCAVTCVSMVLRYHGINITPGIMAKQPIFSSDLIVWPDVWQNVSRVGGYSHGNIDWKVVDQELNNHNPVIVFVRANGRGAGHYVVVHHKDTNGKYVVHDPYWGPNIFLDSTRENIATLYGSSTSIDQMIIYHNNKRNGNADPVAPQSTNTNLNSNINNNANVNNNSNKNTNTNQNTNSNKNKS